MQKQCETPVLPPVTPSDTPLSFLEYSLFTRPKEEFFGSVRCPDGSECLRFTPVEYAELPEDARSRVVHEVEIWR